MHRFPLLIDWYPTLIQDSDTGNILFMGRVMNPNG